MNTREITLTSSDGTQLRIHSFCIEPKGHLHINAGTPQLSLAVAFSLFDSSTDQIRHLGYEIEQFGPPLAKVRTDLREPYTT